MIISTAEPVVFDCPIFAQALINPLGPAAECFTLAQSWRLTLYVSAFVLQEIRELPTKLKPKLGVTAERVEKLIRQIDLFAIPIDNFQPLYVHPIDPDDSPYVNLALAAKACLIVSRDNHLLNLMDANRTEGQHFRRLFPHLNIVTPVGLLREVRATDSSKND